MVALGNSALAVARIDEQKTLSAAAVARVPFGEILQSACRASLTVVHNGKPAAEPAAVLVSAQLHRELLQIAEWLEEEEEKYWAEEARKGRESGFIGEEASAALMREIREVCAKNGY